MVTKHDGPPNYQSQSSHAKLDLGYAVHLLMRLAIPGDCHRPGDHHAAGRITEPDTAVGWDQHHTTDLGRHMAYPRAGNLHQLAVPAAPARDQRVPLQAQEGH